jgi:uracil-DNA glycosylase
MITKLTKKKAATNLISYLKYLSLQPKGFVYKKATEQEKFREKKHLLTVLANRYKKCQHCPLAAQGRTQVVFGVGNPNAKIMFIGEAPGRDEDIQGKPFVGRAGQLLTKIIEAMGLTRDEVYITNVVKSRPPQNRTPTFEERETCKNLILLKEIAIIKPKIICTLGLSATKGLLGDEITISQVRGRFFHYQGTLLMPTYHPAYLLRNPAEKRVIWEDMKKIMEKLKELEEKS